MGSEMCIRDRLSTELVPGPVPGSASRKESFKLDGQPITLGVEKA